MKSETREHEVRTRNPTRHRIKGDSMIGFKHLGVLKLPTLVVFFIGLAVRPGFGQAHVATVVAEEHYYAEAPSSEPQDLNPNAASQQNVQTSDYDRTKSYIIPALEIIGFDFALNRFDRHF